MARFEIRHVGWWLLGLTLAALLTSAWIHEDAYITFRVIDNFLDGRGLTWNPAERVQVYTHPLWLFVLLPLVGLTGDCYFTTLALTAALTLVTVYLVIFRAGLSLEIGCLAAFTLLLSKAFLDYATAGLEDSLTRLLLVLFALVLSAIGSQKGSQAGLRKLVWLFGLSLLAAALALNRPDALLLCLPALGYRLVRAWQMGWKRLGLSTAAVALGLLPLALWGLFAFFYYGSPFPNTAYAKLGMGVPRPWLLLQSAFYLLNSLLRDPVTLAVTAGALVLTVRWPHPVATPLAAGSALYLAYVVWIGGGYMSGRLLSAPFFLAVLALARYPLDRVWRRRPVLALVLALAALTPRIYGPFVFEGVGRIDAHGVGDERRLYYAFTGFLPGLGESRWPDHFFRDWGEAARERPPTQIAVGMYGYFAGPGVHVVDWYGLTDPLLARLPAIVTGPYVTDRSVNWRPGHGRRPIPDGYLESLAENENRIGDPDLARYYEVLRRVTRGELWDWERLRLAWQLNLGRFDAWRDAYVEGHPHKFDRFPPSRRNPKPRELRPGGEPHEAEVPPAHRPGRFLPSGSEGQMGRPGAGTKPRSTRSCSRLETTPSMSPID